MVVYALAKIEEETISRIDHGTIKPGMFLT